jgi:hypothetical protein
MSASITKPIGFPFRLEQNRHYRNARLKSYLVSSGISSVADLVGLSFLLGAQAVTCPAPLQKSAFSTSSQRQHWPMVWIIYASS